MLVRFTYYAFATIAILAFLAMLAVRLLIVPRIGDFRDDITALIADNIGRAVSIGRIDAGWDGWSPTLALTDFKLFDQAGVAALTLPRVETSISWRSILIGEIRLLRLDVYGPQLLIRRDAQGRLHVGGMDVDRSAEPYDPAPAEWLLRQRRVAINDGTLTWVDEMRQAPPLRLDQVNFLIENSFRRHRFGMTGVPPPSLAAPIDIRGEFTNASAASLSQAEGRIYSRLDYIDVAAAKKWLPLPFEMRTGRGAVRNWIEFESGAISDVTMDLELDEVRTRLKPRLPELDLAHVSGRLSWHQRPERLEVSSQGLQLTPRSGVKLTPGDVALRYAAAKDGKPSSGDVRYGQLQLEPLFALLQYLPIEEKLRGRLGQFSPVGTLDAGTFAWTGEPDALKDYSLRAQFRGLGINAVDAFPGATRLSGSIDATAKSGTLNFSGEGSRLDLPRIFAAPLELDTVTAQVSWKVADQLAVKVHKLAFANADTAGIVQGEYRSTAQGPGWADMNGTLSRANIPAVHKYMPATIALPIRNWLRDALVAGKASEARFVVRGNLYDFPFAGSKDGLFLFTAKAANGVLDYADKWPKIENIGADLRFEGSRMEITANTATTVGVRLEKVHVDIPELGAVPAHLLIQGDGAGNTEEFLQYIDKSPVGDWIGHFTQGARAAGAGKLALSLDIPLGRYDESKVTGEYTFADNSMQIGPDVPRLDRASGRFTFNEREFNARDVAGDALGGTATVQVAVSGGKVRVGISGNAELGEVRKLYPFPLSDRLQGRTDWTLNLQNEGSVHGWTIESSLRGIAIDLPEPLGKKPEQAMPLRLERQAIDKTHDRLLGSFGTIARLEASRVLSDSGFQVQRAAFNLGRSQARADRDGFWVRGNVERLELDSWLALGSGQAGGPGAKAGAGEDVGLAGIDLTATSLVAFGRNFRNLHVDARPQPNGWRIAMDSDDLAGTATWQPPADKGSGKVVARLKRLALPQEEAAAASAAPPVPTVPPIRKDLPALDVVAESYVSKGRDLGRLELQAQPDGADWRIEPLALRNPESEIVASGRWRVLGGLQQTRLGIQLNVSDVGRFLARHGVPEGVLGGNGKLTGELTWSGGPQDFNYPTLNGHFRVEATRGQFTRVDPGIGKLLGILNLDALARRLAFDFRDVMAEGYSFDEMSGDVMVRTGVMNTQNLHIAGPSAKVDIAGDADIAQETLRLHIRVQPSLTGGLAAAAAAATVNPLIGAGVLLGSTILRDPVGKMFAGEYEVTGTWVEPRVERAGGRSVDPANTGASR
ncbi:MAG: YhdP family protein [Betaproteobacteria bacterium]